jgi:signal transduction histidine kinase
MTTTMHMAPRTVSTTAAPRAAAAVPMNAARAHEQKNCLSIILAVASLVTPELSKEGRERMERLRAAANRMRDLLNADLARAEDLADVDIGELFSAVCESLRDRAEAANVPIVVKCGGGAVRASEADLKEALFNLVSNAIEATPAERRVFIHTEISATGDHEWRIHDSGAGMHSEMLSQVGIPRRSFREGGSGFGVALARAVIERHGGSLRFDSVCGTGTTVTITLPREQRQPLSGVCDRTEGP